MTCICAQIRVMGKGTPLVYRSSEDSGPPHPIGAWEGRAHALAQITPPPPPGLQAPLFYAGGCWIVMGVFVFLKAVRVLAAGIWRGIA